MLKKLRVVDFKYDEDPTNKNQLGFLLEEVVKVSPELVGYSDETTPKNINKVGMLALLVKGFQELIEQNNEQNAIIANLTARVQALEAIR